MGTWLDAHPAATIRCAGTPAGDHADGTHTGGSARFGLWLELVDLHLDELRVGRSQVDWDWVSAYDQGWSPRTAEFAAWAKHLRPVDLAGQS
jgi:hypothetical protein